MSIATMRAQFQTLQARKAGFARAEDGGVLVFALIIFVLMVMIGGFAIDMMRYETTRVSLQNTLDRSTLAAAAMTQSLDANDVVADYFEKAGLSDQLADIAVTQSPTYRRVRAQGLADTKPFFMHMMGVDKLEVAAAAAAEQGVSNLEIVLVLDVSGSMSGAKIANLRIAAADFVDTMFDSDPFNRVSISVVPYNAQVNLGATLRGKFNATNVHGVTNVDCLELPDAAFATSAIPVDMELPMMAYADLYGGTSYVMGPVSPTNAGFAVPNFGSSFCRPNQENIVRLPSQDRVALRNEIEGLTAGGNTSITLGMKWGLTLLDPSLRPTYGELANEGEIPAGLSNRPYDYDDEEAMKVIILMTDGEHVPHIRVTDAYKTGPSNIWKAEDGNLSVQIAGRPANADFWVPHLSAWQAAKYESAGGPTNELNWEDVWATEKVSYVAWQLFARPLGNGNWGNTVTAYNNTYNAMVQTWKTKVEMDTSLQDSCAFARDNGVIVYGIAFEAPVNGQTQIRNCSTTPDAHYYATLAPEDIQGVFASIATNLTQLRLTQ